MADYVKQFDIGEGENAQNYIIKDAEARDTIEQLQGESEDLEKQITDLNNEDATLNNLIEQANTLIAQLQSAVTAAEGNISSLESDKAPVNHASTAITYGQGDASNFGHVKLSDKYTSSDGAASAGVGASDQALYDAYTELNGNKPNTESVWTFARTGATAVSAGEDMNDFTATGNYYCQQSSAGTQIDNMPAGTAFNMKVLNGNGQQYPVQLMFTHEAKIYARAYNNDRSTWRDWNQVVFCEPGASVGSESTPIYLNNGVPTACNGLKIKTFTLNIGTISAGSYVYYSDIDISNGSLTPVAVAGIRVVSNCLVIASFAITDTNKFTLRIANYTNSASTDNDIVYLDIAYI